ncbi:hypothetical protein [Niallia sp. 01092]|uniref:hypothetical protein n=1 Tax=unclassified Niallia TaxID=2837522 RepID=UPI003FD0BCD9
MKKFFRIISTIAAIIMLSRHAGMPFVSEYYWWIVAIFLIGLIGQITWSIVDKQKKRSLDEGRRT